MTRARVGLFALVVSLWPFACAGASTTSAPNTAARESDRDPLSVRTPLERFVLANGLTVILNEDHRVPLVAVRVVYRVGSNSDPQELSGLAHLTEHLLFHGSRHVANGMHFQLLLEAGTADMNGTTAPERTDLWQVVPASELALALWLESDRMQFGLENVSETAVRAELGILERERAERIDNVPLGRLGEIAALELFPPGHPFREPRLTSPELRNATLADVRAFYAAHYGPGNAVLVLSGDFDPKAATRLVGHYFGDIPNRPNGAKAKLPSPAPTASTLRFEARVDEAAVLVTWPSPPLFEPGDTELDVLASYLNHIAFNPLVEKRRLLSSAFAKQESDFNVSTFLIGADLARGVTHEAALAALDATLDELRQKSLEPERIERFAHGWLYDLYADMDDVSQRSWFLAQAELLSSRADFMTLAKQRYRSVTNTSLRETIARFLGNDRRVVAFVTPNPHAPLAGRVAVTP